MNHKIHSMNTTYTGSQQPGLFAVANCDTPSYSAVDFV